MSFEDMRVEIINTCKKLLMDGTVKSILAFGTGLLDGKGVPIFIRNIDELESMKWDDTCTPNLAKYLLDKKEEIAIVAKPCDARAIVMYLVEKQVNRDNIYIIGVECEGMVNKDGVPSPGCGECTVRIPPIWDAYIKNHDAENTVSCPVPEKPKVDNLEYNLDRFQKEMEKCILCFSCRQACYGCYCKTCFVDRNIPNWLPPELDMGAKMNFHLGRAMHLAGRCVECGACERACPSGVNIRYLIKEITDMCRDMYGCSAGMDINDTPAAAAFNMDDREVGFLGGEDNGICGPEVQDK